MTQALQLLGDALTPLHSHPEFEGAVVKQIADRHHEDPLYDPTHVVGVHVTFRNGMTFSIQWGRSGNYSNIARGNWTPDADYGPEFETAAWYPRTEDDDTLPWYCPELDGPYDRDAAGELGCYDSIQAWQSVEQVMANALKVARHNPQALMSAKAAAGRLLDEGHTPSDLEGQR